MFSFSANPIAALFTQQPAVAEVDAKLALERELLDLYDQLRPGLLRYALSFRLSMDDSEDLVQEVFLALFNRLRMGHTHHNVRGWLFQVTHNLALKRRGALIRHARLQDPLTLHLDHAAGSVPSPESQLLDAERHTHLVAVFQALPVKDQRCLQLRAEGLTYREIAKTIQISLGSVATSLARSLARLASIDHR